MKRFINIKQGKLHKIKRINSEFIEKIYKKY